MCVTKLSKFPLFPCHDSQIIHLLNSCCVQEELGDQVVSDSAGYLLILPSCDAESGNETPVTWSGKKVVVNPTMDTAISLADIQVTTLWQRLVYILLVLTYDQRLATGSYSVQGRGVGGLSSQRV